MKRNSTDFPKSFIIGNKTFTQVLNSAYGYYEYVPSHEVEAWQKNEQTQRVKWYDDDLVYLYDKDGASQTFPTFDAFHQHMLAQHAASEPAHIEVDAGEHFVCVSKSDYGYDTYLRRNELDKWTTYEFTEMVQVYKEGDVYYNDKNNELFSFNSIDEFKRFFQGEEEPKPTLQRVEHRNQTVLTREPENEMSPQIAFYPPNERSTTVLMEVWDGESSTVDFNFTQDELAIFIDTLKGFQIAER